MSLIYVTGISGSGKTTVAKQLSKRGYEAYDADGDGFNSWHNKIAGKRIETPENVDLHTPEWYKKHTWKTSRKKIKELAGRGKNKLIFLCGVSSNENELWDLFSKVICLVIDEKTLRHRIATRTSNEFGKAPHELKDVLHWHKSNQEAYRNSGIIIIDATQSVDRVVDEILKITAS